MDTRRLMQRLEDFVARSDGDNRRLALDVIEELDRRTLILRRANEAMDDYEAMVRRLVAENHRLRGTHVRHMLETEERP